MILITDYYYLNELRFQNERKFLLVIEAYEALYIRVDPAVLRLYLGATR